MSDNQIPMTIFGLRNDVRFPIGATRVADGKELAAALHTLGAPHVMQMVEQNTTHLRNAPHGLFLCVTQPFADVDGAQLRYERVSQGEDGDAATGALAYNLALFADGDKKAPQRQFLVVAPVPEPSQCGMVWVQPPHARSEDDMEIIERFDVDPVSGAPLDVEGLIQRPAASDLRH